MVTKNNYSQESVENYYRNANIKYHQHAHVEPLNITLEKIPHVNDLHTTKVLYQKFPYLKLIQQPMNIVDDCPVHLKLYTSTTDYTNNIKMSFSSNSGEMEAWFQLIVNHCCYVLYLVKNHYHPALTYNFLREVYTTYAETMGCLMLSSYGNDFDKMVKTHKQHLFDNDKEFGQWIDEQYSIISQSLNNLEVKDMHDFVFWTKDLCDDNDIITHFLPSKIKALYKQHVSDLVDRIQPKTKKQWMIFFSEFQNINQMIANHLESRETDPLLLSHIREENKATVAREIIHEMEFIHLFQYGYEILICGDDTIFQKIQNYFDTIDIKDKKFKSEFFFDHLKETINKRIVEPNKLRAHWSTPRLLDVYLTLFCKLDRLNIDSFSAVFRGVLHPVLETLQRRSDLFTLLSYCFFHNRRELLDYGKVIHDNNDVELLDKFFLLISRDKSMDDPHRQQILDRKNVSSWFKKKYSHKKLYSEETLEIKVEENKFKDYVKALGEVMYNANMNVNEESMILQVINSLTCSNKEGFLSKFVEIYQDYLLRICDRETDGWNQAFMLLLKLMFGGYNDEAEEVETAVKTMLLNMTASSLDYENHVYRKNCVELMVLAGEYWNVMKAPKYTRLLQLVLYRCDSSTNIGGLFQRYKFLHKGQQLFLNGEKSTMKVKLFFNDGRVISRRCSILEGALINKISSVDGCVVSIHDILCMPEFSCFGREEIEESLGVWEALNVLNKVDDQYEVIEDMREFCDMPIVRGTRKRVLASNDGTMPKKVMKVERQKDERLNELDVIFEQLVVSTLDVRQGGLGALEIKEWLCAALPEYAKKSIPKMKSGSTKAEEITMEEYLDYLVSKGKLKKSKAGMYHSKRTRK
ncbi:uncharacterized protein HGUI_02439 [Hanseniaspora guilliermondii]|uniref:Uncharacterized protein n=1 Tax=Hanseniaspora guilliermondii TaxID=56406 RepID=A0A1L0CZE4_9ASCO|nr:uncharacterized protein HGUI_02439 [Hanseniaspora guilliermondii]